MKISLESLNIEAFKIGMRVVLQDGLYEIHRLNFETGMAQRTGIGFWDLGSASDFVYTEINKGKQK